MIAIQNFTVYILECSDLSFYVGITNDIDRRLFEHESGFNKSSYTFSRRPVKQFLLNISMTYQMPLHSKNKSKAGAEVKRSL